MNPCNCDRPLAADPESWTFSSFAGYARKSKRVDWIQYDLLHTYWNASVGGENPDAAYRKYVKEGLNSAEDPFRTELREWVFGSEEFLRRMVRLAEGSDSHRHRSTIRRIKSVSVEEIIDATRPLTGWTRRSTPCSAAERLAATWQLGFAAVGLERPSESLVRGSG